LFPKESLTFYEITELFDIELGIDQDEAAGLDYFAVSSHDPAPLAVLLDHWLHQDHLLS
jgi:hypothetical protein